MSIQVKRRREAATFLSTYTGAQGELLVDTTNNRVQVHDGATPGGFAAAKLSEVAGLAPVQSVAGRTGAVALALADIAGAAPLASPVFTGAPTAPTAAPGTASTQIATTAYADRSATTNFSRTAVNDTNYTALASDRTIAFAAITAARTLTLPAASSFPVGVRLVVLDESGACSPALPVTVVRSGGDLVNGATSTSLSTAFGYLALISNGAGRWTIVDQSPYSSLTTLAQSASLAAMQLGVAELLVTLSGASVTTSLQIPNRALVFAVSSRTVVAVAGAPSYGVGVAGNPTQFGGSLGAAAGSTNVGVIGPTAFYAPTPLVVTATSGSFTGGQVRLALQYLLCSPPAI